MRGKNNNLLPWWWLLKTCTSQKFGHFCIQHRWLCKHTSTSCGLRKPPLGGSTTPITSPLPPGGLSKCLGSTSSALPQRNSVLVIPEWVGGHKKPHMDLTSWITTTFMFTSQYQGNPTISILIQSSIAILSNSHQFYPQCQSSPSSIHNVNLDTMGYWF